MEGRPRTRRSTREAASASVGASAPVKTSKKRGALTDISNKTGEGAAAPVARKEVTTSPSAAPPLKLRRAAATDASTEAAAAPVAAAAATAAAPLAPAPLSIPTPTTTDAAPASIPLPPSSSPSTGVPLEPMEAEAPEEAVLPAAPSAPVDDAVTVTVAAAVAAAGVAAGAGAGAGVSMDSLAGEAAAPVAVPVATSASEAAVLAALDVTPEDEDDVIRDIDSLEPHARSFTEYVSDVYSYLRSLEVAHNISPTYMTDTQPDVNPAMRSILIDWLVEVAEEYGLLPETLYICVSYIDRCLTAFQVSRSKLQLLGCACMLLASKYEEIFAPPIDQFVYISDNTYDRDEILKMETIVLNEIGFRLAAATPKQFLRRFIKAANSDQNQIDLINYLAELTLQEYAFVKFRPSLVAASAVLAARLTLRVDRPWNATLAHYTQYPVSELLSCTRAILAVHRAAPTNNLQAVREKYSLDHFSNVAVKVVPLPEDEAIGALGVLMTRWRKKEADRMLHTSGALSPTTTNTATAAAAAASAAATTTATATATAEAQSPSSTKAKSKAPAKPKAKGKPKGKKRSTSKSS